MKKLIYIGILAAVLVYCFNALTSEDEKTNVQLSDYQIAEQHAMNFEPKKAVPYLERIRPTDPDYKKAQDLLKTINSAYGEEPEPNSVEESQPKNQLTEEQRKQLVEYQREWANLQISSEKHHKDYLIDYEWTDLNTVYFVLNKYASETGSLQGHEETWVPSLSKEYLEGLNELGLPLKSVAIHFKRKTGVSNSQLTTSSKGWLPAEYLWFDVKLYFGHGEEKGYIGQVIDGEEIDGKKYVVLRTKSGTTERKSLEHIKSAAYYIKADDPNVKARVLRFN